MTALSYPGTSSADLKARLKVSVRVKRLRALALVAPLLVFIAVVFLGPIYLLLERSVAVPEMGAMLPNTARALADWRGPDVPMEPAWAALVEDLRNVQAAGRSKQVWIDTEPGNQRGPKSGDLGRTGSRCPAASIQKRRNQLGCALGRSRDLGNPQAVIRGLDNFLLRKRLGPPDCRV